MHIHRIPAAAVAAAAVLAAGCGSRADRPAPARPAATATAVVPDLVGVEQTRAHALAARRGFQMRWMGHVGRLANGHTSIACVKVFSQSPVAGERRPRGASISVLEIACRTPRGTGHDAAGA